MLVGIKVTHDPDVETVHRDRIGKLKDRVANELTQRVGLQYQFLPSSGHVLRHPWLAEAQVIQLFNLHGGYLSPRLLPRLSRRAPIVWRLSDMWPLTGHCAYSGVCERWRTGCGRCPDLASYPPIGVDTSAWLWRQKRGLYSRSDITVVTPSSWTESLARQSPLFAGCEVRRIPNGIDTAVFKPRDRAMARALLDLDPAAKLILFVAHELDNNPRKGGSHLIEALRRVQDVPNLQLLLVGLGGEEWSRAAGVPVHRMGYVTDDRLLAAIYSSADIIAAPSVLENLPNTVLEAMACGIPGVAFDTGGMADAVQHQKTGILVPFGDTVGLSQGIRELLTDNGLRERLARNAVLHVQALFSKKRQAQSFAELYQEIVDGRRSVECGSKRVTD
ncbi:MAG: hypothetical protein AMS22_07975 [Thiotrichales bacterium SG8_50]|jgi:glycosyltransferase involved in cell wall biosynthesis|nr:MAG: hypothetical protein AMS22_07975 [Thiotrichales bacterium SG8_50]